MYASFIIIFINVLLITLCFCDSNSTRRYQIRKKAFSIGTGFEVKNEEGQNVFNVQKQFFSFSKKFALEDINGNALYKIHQEVWNWRPTYKIISAQNDTEVATIKKKFAFFSPKFSITSIFGDYSLEALDTWIHSFKLVKKERVVATISKKYFTLLNSYGIDIVEDEDHPFIITLVIVLDQIIFVKKNKD